MRCLSLSVIMFVRCADCGICDFDRIDSEGLGRTCEVSEVYKSASTDVKDRPRAEIWWILVTWPEAGFGWRRITSANRNPIRIGLELGTRF